MKILIGIKGPEGDAYLRRVAALAPLPIADRIILAHVIDTGPRGDLELGRDRYLTRRRLPESRTLDITGAEKEASHEALTFAHSVLLDAGIDEGRINEVILSGKPRETLRDLAEREQIDLIVVAARHGKPGPHSLGKTARFLVDHAPSAALLVREL
ncbi:MAG: universal stress protein [Chloroflexota bacterium]